MFFIKREKYTINTLFYKTNFNVELRENRLPSFLEYVLKKNSCVVIFCVWKFCLHVCLCTTCMQCPLRPKEIIRSSETYEDEPPLQSPVELLFYYILLNLDL